MIPPMKLSRKVYDRVRKELAAGKKVAVFVNQDLGHRDAGHAVAVFVGPENTWKNEADVPSRLPDGTAGIGIAWRYQRYAVTDQIGAFSAEED